MKNYIRIQNGICFEVIATDEDISTLYHPSLEWIEITDVTPRPSLGWTYKDGVFTEASADLSLNVFTPAEQPGEDIVQSGSEAAEATSA